MKRHKAKSAEGGNAWGQVPGTPGSRFQGGLVPGAAWGAVSSSSLDVSSPERWCLPGKPARVLELSVFIMIRSLRFLKPVCLGVVLKPPEPESRFRCKSQELPKRGFFFWK